VGYGFFSEDTEDFQYTKEASW